MWESIQAWITIAVMIFIVVLCVLPYIPKKTRMPVAPTRINSSKVFAEQADSFVAQHGGIAVLPNNLEVRQDGGQVDARETINKIREMRSNYEMEIADAIGPILERFEAESGMNALGVRVDMHEVTGMYDTRPRYAVTRACIDVERV